MSYRTCALIFVFLCSSVYASDVVDLREGWRFRPDPNDAGMAERWFSPDLVDDAWSPIEVGKRWEDQGFAEVDGYAWYRLRTSVPAEWKENSVWLTLGGVNDAYVLFCNGERVNAFGDRNERSVHQTNTVADLTPFLRFGEKNCISIRVYDWGASGGLWRDPCQLTTDRTRLPNVPSAAYILDHEAQELSVEVDCLGLGDALPEGTVIAELTRQGQALLLGRLERPLAGGEQPIQFTFDIENPEPEMRYRVTVSAIQQDGRAIGPGTTKLDLVWPGQPAWPSKYSGVEVLNNFVTELLLQTVSRDDLSVQYDNPREGWVFLALSGENAGAVPDSLEIIVDDREESLVLRPNRETGAREAMQFLSEGRHGLRIKGAAGLRLVVRAVPEIVYCSHPTSPHIPQHGSYDWPYLERYVLSHVNTIVTSGTPPPEDILSQWSREGRQWLGNCSLPGLGAAEPPAIDDVYKVWAQSPGMTDARYGGIIVDEFLSAGAGHYRAWSGAVERVHENPDFDGKTYYAYCTDIFHLPETPPFAFGKMLMDRGDRFALERYLPEPPDEEAARRLFHRQLQIPMRATRAALPEWQRRTVIVLGYLSAPPESLNRDPSVDYKVFMDMQFQYLATDPSFWGLYGIMEYLTSYADEETVRWAHRLFRHYCIEGHRDRLSRDPYQLTHLENPDFTDGLTGWQSEPAAEQSIRVDEMEGFSWLQGRYPRTTQGDRFVCMRRTTDRPNTLKQTVKNLEPGRLYSLKLISADRAHLDRKSLLPLHIELLDAERLEDQSFQAVFPSCYSHTLGPYNRNHPAWLNYHRVVFRPRKSTAALVLSDWPGGAKPDAGEAEVELAFNFVEVQPFLEP